MNKINQYKSVQFCCVLQTSLDSFWANTNSQTVIIISIINIHFSPSSMLLSKVTSVKLAEELKKVHDYLQMTGPTCEYAGRCEGTHMKTSCSGGFPQRTHTLIHTHTHTHTAIKLTSSQVLKQKKYFSMLRQLYKTSEGRNSCMIVRETSCMWSGTGV